MMKALQNLDIEVILYSVYGYELSGLVAMGIPHFYTFWPQIQ